MKCGGRMLVEGGRGGGGCVSGAVVILVEVPYRLLVFGEFDLVAVILF